MPKKGRVNREMRRRKDAAMSGEKPANLAEPTRKLSPDELELQKARDKSAGAMDKSARVNREREFTRRDRDQEW